MKGVELYFLIGFMGAGKTTLGKAAARKLDIPFLDLDEELERSANQSIPEIFEAGGEALFRKLERTQLEKCLNLAPGKYLVACGGGTPCFGDNMEWMKVHGKVIFLHQDLGILVGRLRKDKEHRPLVSGLEDGEIRPFIESMLEKRLPFYRQAHVILEKSTLSSQQLVEVIKEPSTGI